MKKIILTIMFVMLFTMNAFAYTWVENGENWNVLNTDTGELCKNFLFDTGDGVYYLDENGNMVTGWWKNPTSGKAYFFSNDINHNYGEMLFGLHMIDGYQRYFNDDGTLFAADKQGVYLNAIDGYWADTQGMLYFSNEVVRDTSVNKSEYYSDPIYYTLPELNNLYLATYGTAYQPLEKLNEKGKVDKAPAKNDKAIDQASTGNVKTSASRTTGGTNYTIDSQGKIHMDETVTPISDFEKYGPMKR